MKPLNRRNLFAFLIGSTILTTSRAAEASLRKELESRYGQVRSALAQEDRRAFLSSFALSFNPGTSPEQMDKLAQEMMEKEKYDDGLWELDLSKETFLGAKVDGKFAALYYAVKDVKSLPPWRGQDSHTPAFIMYRFEKVNGQWLVSLTPGSEHGPNGGMTPESAVMAYRSEVDDPRNDPDPTVADTRQRNDQARNAAAARDLGTEAAPDINQVIRKGP